MIIEYQVSVTVSLEISGIIMDFMATLGTIADITQTVFPDDMVRTDFTLLTYSS